MRCCLIFICILAAHIAISKSAELDETQLVDLYGGVQSWFTFSRRYDISEECAGDDPLRVAYFTKHDGTLWDFIAVATRLGIPWTTMNPMLFHPAFAIDVLSYNDHDSARRTWDALGQMYCHLADILMFGDILSFSRPLLQGGCTTPIILHVTARFNALMTTNNLFSYDQLMAEAVTWPHVWWVCNNPYEKWHMESRGIKLPKERTLLLRPLGVSLLPRFSPPINTSATMEAKVAVLHNPNRTASFDNKVLFPWLQMENLLDDVAVLPKYYGGPSVLASYKGLVHVPYQVSVMKMYEGLAAGAIFILPSISFFAKLLGDHRTANFCCRQLIKENPDTWSDYVDWYHPEFRDCLVYFDSWDELRAIIKGEGKYTPQLLAGKRLLGKQTMQRIRAESLTGFEALFKEVKRRACEDNGKPDVWSAGMETGAYRLI